MTELYLMNLFAFLAGGVWLWVCKRKPNQDIKELLRRKEPGAMKDGGPAFPSDPAMYGSKAGPGMSLRDWFAGMVSYQEIELLANDEDISHQEARYVLADRLIRQRDKESKIK